MKNTYRIEEGTIVFRRATKDDDFARIVKLIYETDPYIYPYWFKNDINEAINVIIPRMTEEGFIFNYENFYVAYEVELKKIVGVVGAIDPTTNLDYDYSSLEAVNHNYDFTIKNYLKVLIDEVKEKKYMYITNICIDVTYREKRIGYRLLKYFIEQMHDVGFDEIGFDCLMHNLRAKNLYHSLGFKEVSEGFGFDGTDNSTVEIVFFFFFKTKFTADDFQMKQSTDIKDVDLEREKYLLDCMLKKKNDNVLQEE